MKWQRTTTTYHMCHSNSVAKQTLSMKPLRNIVLSSEAKNRFRPGMNLKKSEIVLLEEGCKRNHKTDWDWICLQATLTLTTIGFQRFPQNQEQSSLFARSRWLYWLCCSWDFSPLKPGCKRSAVKQESLWQLIIEPKCSPSNEDVALFARFIYCFFCQTRPMRRNCSLSQYRARIEQQSMISTRTISLQGPKNTCECSTLSDVRGRQ